MDPFNSFTMSGSLHFDFDDKETDPEHIDPTVEARDNILATVRQEEWYKVRVSGIHHHHVD
jgi:hypothetical protein